MDLLAGPEKLPLGIAQALVLMNQDFNMPLRVVDIARHAGLSAYQFSQVFLKIGRGVSPRLPDLQTSQLRTAIAGAQRIHRRGDRDARRLPSPISLHVGLQKQDRNDTRCLSIPRAFCGITFKHLANSKGDDKWTTINLHAGRNCRRLG
jgi:hypothetical protein